MNMLKLILIFTIAFSTSFCFASPESENKMKCVYSEDSNETRNDYLAYINLSYLRGNSAFGRFCNLNDASKGCIEIDSKLKEIRKRNEIVSRYEFSFSSDYQNNIPLGICSFTVSYEDSKKRLEAFDTESNSVRYFFKVGDLVREFYMPYDNTNKNKRMMLAKESYVSSQDVLNVEFEEWRYIEKIK